MDISTIAISITYYFIIYRVRLSSMPEWFYNEVWRLLFFYILGIAVRIIYNILLPPKLLRHVLVFNNNIPNLSFSSRGQWIPVTILKKIWCLWSIFLIILLILLTIKFVLLLSTYYYFDVKKYIHKI